MTEAAKLRDALTEREALRRLRAVVDDLGSQKAAAAHLNISPSYLCDVLDRRRDPHKVLERIGLHRVVFYVEQEHGD